MSELTIQSSDPGVQSMDKFLSKAAISIAFGGGIALLAYLEDPSSKEKELSSFEWTLSDLGWYGGLGIIGIGAVAAVARCCFLYQVGSRFWEVER